MKYKIGMQQKTWEVEVVKNSGGEIELRCNGTIYKGHLEAIKDQFSLLLEGRSILFSGETKKPNHHVLRLRGRVYPIHVRGEDEGVEEDSKLADGIYSEVSPMPGLVKEVRSVQGKMAAEGETLMVLEAMKMEIEIKAQYGGVIQKIFPQSGSSVQEGDRLFQIQVEKKKET